MPAKSERFEMRLEEGVLARIDRWRAEQDDVPTRAEAMRRLVELGLARSSEESVTFSDGEKMLLLMMRDLFKHLKVEGDSDPEFLAEVIYGGHYWAPKWELQSVFHNHSDDPRDLRLVVDVLDMWSFIEEGYERLTKEDREWVEKEANLSGPLARFTGFDGNNEGNLLSIADFLIKKMDRFTRFKKRDLNSHMRMADRYRRMYQVFEPVRATLIGVGLNKDQIVDILKARRWPAGAGN